MRVAIVGMSNVGKSTLFNKLCRKNLAIIFDQEHTTMDYISCHLGDTILSDTVGLSTIKDFDSLCGKFILENDIILYVIDYSVGVQKIDYELSRFFKRHRKRIWLVANKCDIKLNSSNVFLPCEKQFIVSSEHNIGLQELSKQLNIKLNDDNLESIAIVGRCNSGKSTLMNRLLRKNRVKTSKIIGTTRDCIQEKINTNHNEFMFIDTAGYRDDREHLERITTKRRQQTLKECIGAIILLDGTMGLTHIDKTIIREIMKTCHFMIVVVNKCDKLTEKTVKSFEFLQLPIHIPLIELSALKRINVDKLLRIVDLSSFEIKKRFSTNELNNWLKKSNLSLKDFDNRPLSIKYLIQPNNVKGITIIYFSLYVLSKDSEVYFKRKLAEAFNLVGAIIRLKWNNSKKVKTNKVNY